MIIFLVLNRTRDLICVDWKGIRNSNPFQDERTTTYTSQNGKIVDSLHESSFA